MISSRVRRSLAVEVRSKDDYGPASDTEYAAYSVGAPETSHVFLMGEIPDAEPALPGWRMALRDIFHS